MANFTCLYPFNAVRKQADTRFRVRIRIGNSYLISFILLAATTMIFASCTLDAVQSELYFVKETADSGGDGKSWETAFTHPLDALDVAGFGDQIWVAEGVYGPRNDGNRNVIALKSGVQVIGGFTGVESDTSQRSPEMAITVLDGQGFAYHVVSAVGADEAVLDGFTITNGNASGSGIESDNGGEFTGGGIFNVYSSLEIRRCRFSGNVASYKGGAIYNEESSPLVVDCIFEKNSAHFGGAVYNFFSSPTTINSIFRENESYISGGAVANFTSSPTYVNSLFSGNQATYTGGAILST